MGKRGAKAGGPAAGGDALMLFSAPVREWFARAFDAPTPVQAEAWQAIARGESALVIAPTGSGKTLAAFLFAIDRLMAEKAAAQAAGERWAKGVRVLYVSPLKALGADVARNLRGPLAGIGAAAAAAGAAARFRTWAEAAMLIFPLSSPTNRARSAPLCTLGFSTKSTAPASRASSTLMGRELTTITGTGWMGMSFFRKSMPFIRGISTSRVTTSGWSERIFSIASKESTAVPMISIRGS